MTPSVKRYSKNYYTYELWFIVILFHFAFVFLFIFMTNRETEMFCCLLMIDHSNYEAQIN